MKLDEEQLYTIEIADNITGCYSSTTEETHWLNEEEAYLLIESLVEQYQGLKNENDNLKNELELKQEQVEELSMVK